MPLLRPGDPFPQLTLAVPGGQTVVVPDLFAGGFGVMLFNRGGWCPYCTAQLRAFQRKFDLVRFEPAARQRIRAAETPPGGPATFLVALTVHLATHRASLA